MLIEIDSGSKLYLEREGGGDRETFAQVFREVWLSIPMKFRESMDREWKSGIKGQASSPMIHLVRHHRYAGENMAFGHSLWFNADVAQMMQRETHLQALIAHELGHVWHYPVKGSHVANPHSTWEEKECEADRLAVHWGFDMTALREWTDANGEEIEAMTGTPHKSWKLDCTAEWSSAPKWA